MEVNEEPAFAYEKEHAIFRDLFYWAVQIGEKGLNTFKVFNKILVHL